MDISAIPASDVVQDPRRENHHDDPEAYFALRAHQHRSSLHLASSLTAGSIPGNEDNDLSDIPQQFVRQIFGFNPFRTSYWSLFRPIHDWSSRIILLCAIVCAIAAGVPLPIIGVIFSHIIDSFPPAEPDLLKSIRELLGVATGYFFLTWCWSTCWATIGERVSRRFREALVEKAVGMDMNFYDVEDIDITGVLTGSTQTIQLGTSEKVGLFIQSISYFIAAFTVGFVLNARLTGILFAAVIPTMVIFVLTGTTIVSKTSKQATGFFDRAATAAEGAIGSVQVVQAFGAINILSENHYCILRQALRKGITKSIAGSVMLGAVYFTCYAANALAFYEGSRLSKDGAGTIYAVVFLILDASFVVGQFGPFIQTFAQAASAGSKVLDILDHPPPQVNVYSNDGVKCNDSTFDGDIVFDNVEFRYPARVTTRVLHAIDLKFKPYTTTGIVGLSGSGKSTIASLLLRFYDPFSGHVRIGNLDISQINVASFRSHISLVDQNPTLFSGTILENIRYGIVQSEQLSETEVFERCKQAALEANADFIAELPNGLQTKIGMAGGTSLSGGQRQRICLARAIVRRPKLMILDEPTSALDTNSEALILQSLKRVSSSGCTVIMIAHRLATIKDADSIVVMGHGAVLEQGSHDELLGRDGPYKQLVEAQGMTATQAMSSRDTSPDKFSDSSALTVDLDKNRYHQEDGTMSPEETSTMLPLIQIMQRCLGLSRPERPLVILGLFASICSGALVVGEAVIFGHLVSIINGGHGESTPQRSEVDFYCLCFFIISLVALFAHSTSGSCFGLVSESLILRVRDISLRTVLKQDLAWFSTPRHSPHELMASINMDTGHLSGLSGVIIGTVFSVATSIVGGIVLAHAVAWKIAIVLLAAVPLMITAGFLRLRTLAKSEERHETAYNGAAALASEACRSIRTVAALGRETHVLQAYRHAILEPYKQSFKFNLVANFTLAFSLAITYFVYALAYWWGSQQVRNGKYTQQDFFIVLPALLFSAQAAGQMFSLAPEVTRARSAASSVFKLHDEKPTILQNEDSSIQTGFLGRVRKPKQGISSKFVHHKSAADDSYSIQRRRGAINLEHVQLSYPSRPADLVLNDVSLDIQPGQLIGVVGESGAGKSSLIALLERFYDVSEGAVRVDGNDIRELPVTKYRNRLSLVSQEPDLFAGSIDFNIRLGAKNDQVVSRDDIENICAELGVHDFIMSLPEGYETDCGYNGSKLSGGQKQRIAIARALVRDPEILLLDEATASLDSQSERQIHNATMAAARNRTTIIVAHRLSTVQHADSIFVLDKGKVAEHGRHEELIENDGIYASMVRAQNLEG